MDTTLKKVFLCGEGKGERIFLIYLKSIYDTRHSNVKVERPVKLSGGSPLRVVEDAIGTLKHRYNWNRDMQCSVVILVDNDRDEIQKAQQLAKQHNFVLLENNPNLEATLYLILGKKFSKKQIKDNMSKRFLQQHFSRPVLEKKRAKVKILNILISYIETGDPPDTKK